MQRADQRVAHVEHRLRELLADGDGVVRYFTLMNRLDYSHRVVVPVVLASGAFVVTDEPGGIRIRARETS